MQNLQRKEFLKRLGCLSLAAVILPEFLANRLNAAASHSAGGKAAKLSVAELTECGIVDMHFHTLKIYLWGLQMKHKHHPSRGDNYLAMQTDIHRIKKGYMKGYLATHYLPEIGMVQKMKTLKMVFPFIRVLFPKFTAKIETGDAGNFFQLKGMLSQVANQIGGLAAKGEKIRIVNNFADFKKATTDGYIAVAHAVEGAHALGRSMDHAVDYINNLHEAKKLGVAMITLAHFFKNDISHPVEGMAPNEKFLTDYDGRYIPKFDNKGLTVIGHAVVAEMLKIGMVVDLTHSTPRARKDVFDLNDSLQKKRPLIFSHVGVQNMFFEGMYPNYKWYNPNDAEIDRIIDCDGTVGVIFENYWLTGCNSNINWQGYKPKDYKKGITYIIETVDYICDRTEKYYRAKYPNRPYDPALSYRHISLGSDFDGLADSPADLHSPSQLPHLMNAMYQHGILEPDIKKIFNENAMRVLEFGWT